MNFVISCNLGEEIFQQFMKLCLFFSSIKLLTWWFFDQAYFVHTPYY